MQLSVIILNYQVRYFLEACLDSVQRAISGMEAEIIVVDNHSADDSCAMIRERFPEVRLIENTSNLGFAKANNQAAQLARGEYLCILNPDTLVSESGFKKMYAFAKAQTQLGAVGPRLIDGSGYFLPESKRCIPTPKVALQKLLGFESSYYAVEVPEIKIAAVPIQVGAYLFMTRSVFQEVSGFDEDYFMYGEDIDLSYRLLKKGYINYYHGEVSAVHFKGESTSRDAAYYDRFYGAMQIFYRKHFTNSSILNFGVCRLINIAKGMKRTVAKASNTNKRTFDQILLISHTEELIQPLKSCFEVVIRLVTPADIQELQVNASMIVFDMNDLLYEDLIIAWEHLKNQKNYYRLRPANCNFIIGSDDSTDQGEVILFGSLKN